MSQKRRKSNHENGWAKQDRPATVNVRRRKRRLFRYGIIVAIGALLCTKPYFNWKSSHFTVRAENSLADGRHEQAALEARIALSADAANRDAIDHLAEAYEALSDPRLLTVLEKLAGEKESLRYARAALEFGEIELAKESLEEFHPEDSTEAVEYSSLGVQLAEKTGNGDALFDHLENLARATEAGSELGYSAVFKLAGLAALSGRQRMPDDLQDRLQACAQSGGARALDAAVLLWAISSRHEVEERQAAIWLEQLVSATDDDYNELERTSTALFRAMDFSIAFESDAWREILSALQKKASVERNPLFTGIVLQWMQRHGQFKEVAEWANRLSSSLSPDPDDAENVLRTIILARVLVADACARAGDWEGVGRWCDGTEWGAHEYLRSLLIACALSSGSREAIPVHAQRWLRLAIGQALERSAGLKSLEIAVRTYGSRGLWIELHRGIAAKSSNREVRLRSLLALKQATLEIGNLILFRETSEQLAEFDPDNWGDQHNALFASALMEIIPASTVPALRALKKAQPGSADVAVSLALALARTGNLTDAVETIESLSFEEREVPGIAPFCAIVYGLAGEHEQAQTYASLPAKLHFPESHKLFMAARHAGD